MKEPQSHYLSWVFFVSSALPWRQKPWLLRQSVTTRQRVRSKVRKWAGYMVYSPLLGKQGCPIWMAQMDVAKTLWQVGFWDVWRLSPPMKIMKRIPATQQWANKIRRGATDLFAHHPEPRLFSYTITLLILLHVILLGVEVDLSAAVALEDMPSWPLVCKDLKGVAGTM